MKDYIYNRKNGGTTYCYGTVEPDSNFEVICRDESHDGIYTDYEGQLTWLSVCKYLEENYNDGIEELVSC